MFCPWYSLREMGRWAGSSSLLCERSGGGSCHWRRTPGICCCRTGPPGCRRSNRTGATPSRTGFTTRRRARGCSRTTGSCTWSSQGPGVRDSLCGVRCSGFRAGIGPHPGYGVEAVAPKVLPVAHVTERVGPKLQQVFGLRRVPRPYWMPNSVRTPTAAVSGIVTGRMPSAVEPGTSRRKSLNWGCRWSNAADRHQPGD